MLYKRSGLFVLEASQLISCTLGGKPVNIKASEMLCLVMLDKGHEMAFPAHTINPLSL